MKTQKIPDSPKIKMKNYIPKLSDNVVVILKEEIIQQFINNERLDNIATSLGFLTTSLKRYSKRKRYLLFFLKELDKMTNNNLFELIENNKPIFFSKWKEVSLPSRITPKLSYFIGYLQGDGSIESNKKRINFSDEYFGQIKRINELSSELFGIGGRIMLRTTEISKKPAYQLETGSLVLNSYLHSVFKINRGVKKNLHLPNSFLKNKEILRWYLNGLFDADGTLPKNPKKVKQLFVDITLKDKEFILQIQEALASFAIQTLKPYCRVAKSPNSNFISKTWELRLRRKTMIIKFLNTVGFSHPDKYRRQMKILYLHAPVAQFG